MVDETFSTARLRVSCHLPRLVGVSGGRREEKNTNEQNTFQTGVASNCNSLSKDTKHH